MLEPPKPTHPHTKYVISLSYFVELLKYRYADKIAGLPNIFLREAKVKAQVTDRDGGGVEHGYLSVSLEDDVLGRLDSYSAQAND